MMSGHHMVQHDAGVSQQRGWAATGVATCMHVLEDAQVRMPWGSLHMLAALVSASS